MKTIFKKTLACLMASLLMSGGMMVTGEVFAKSDTTKTSLQAQKAGKKQVKKAKVKKATKVKKHKKSTKK